jgi:hypothetical protein
MRHLFIRQQTTIRAHLAEFEIVAPVGRKGVEDLLRVVGDPKDKQMSQNRPRMPRRTRCSAANAQGAILKFERMINAWHRSSKTGKELEEIPGVGPALATALVAGVANPKVFRSGPRFLDLDRARTEAPLLAFSDKRCSAHQSCELPKTLSSWWARRTPTVCNCSLTIASLILR